MSGLRKKKINSPLKAENKPDIVEVEGIPGLTPEKIKVLLQEFSIHQVELETQVEDLKAAQEELHCSRDRYQHLYDSVPVGLVTLDKKYSILESNTTAARMLGTSLILRRSRFTDFIAHSDKARKAFNSYIRDIRKTGCEQAVEMEMQRLDGSRFWAYLQTSLAESSSEGESRFHITISDITERMKGRIDLSERTLQLESANNRLEAEIKEHRLADEDVLRHTATVNAINRIFREYLTASTREDLVNSCLLIAQELTGSRFGFIGEIGADGLLHDLAISETSWEACVMLDKSGHRRLPGNFKIHGLYGRVLMTGKSLLTNRPQSHPAGNGTPEGHPALNSFLGVPFIYGGKTIGMLGLANREGGYRDEDKLAAEALAPAIIEALKRKQAEEDLAKAGSELENKVQERTEQLQEAYDEIMQSRDRLAAANRQLKQYGHRITEVQEEERKRIAYELHDDTAQYLSILKMQIGALLQSGKTLDPEVKERLEFLERDADRAFNDVRRYSHELRPVVLEHMGLLAALEQIAEDYNKMGQLSIAVSAEGFEPELSEEVKLGFFRVAQEALNNARKHARAEKVEICLEFEPEQLCMTVSDNGVGFDTRKAFASSGGRGSLGLLSMRERADLINAELKIESAPGHGTKVTIKAKV